MRPSALHCHIGLHLITSQRMHLGPLYLLIGTHQHVSLILFASLYKGIQYIYITSKTLQDMSTPTCISNSGCLALHAFSVYITSKTLQDRFTPTCIYNSVCMSLQVHSVYTSRLKHFKDRSTPTCIFNSVCTLLHVQSVYTSPLKHCKIGPHQHVSLILFTCLYIQCINITSKTLQDSSTPTCIFNSVRMSLQRQSMYISRVKHCKIGLCQQVSLFLIACLYNGIQCIHYVLNPARYVHTIMHR